MPPGFTAPLRWCGPCRGLPDADLGEPLILEDVHFRVFCWHHEMPVVRGSKFCGYVAPRVTGRGSFFLSFSFSGLHLRLMKFAARDRSRAAAVARLDP